LSELQESDSSDPLDHESNLSDPLDH